MKTGSKKLSIPHLIDAERDLAFKPDMGTNSFFAIADVETEEGRKDVERATERRERWAQGFMEFCDEKERGTVWSVEAPREPPCIKEP